MNGNLLKDKWLNLDSAELRILLDKRIGGPGQYEDLPANPNSLHLPLGGPSCRLVATFDDKEIIELRPGPAFDTSEWSKISQEIDSSLLAGPIKVSRYWSFSSFRVLGSWRGAHSGIQILPPPDDAPSAPVELAAHPFILEFPIRTSEVSQITNHRMNLEHRRLTLLLNVLLMGRTSLLPQRPQNFWACGAPNRESRPVNSFQKLLSWWRRFRGQSAQPQTGPETQWVQENFCGNLGQILLDQLSPPAGSQLEELDPREYYNRLGHDGKGLRVPTDLDQSICIYKALSKEQHAKFDRATFWMDMASRQWTISVSASFAALVSAIESLTERGTAHSFDRPICSGPTQHEVPGPTQLFRDFFDTYASGPTLRRRRSEMYALRSGILHGNRLMQLDQDRAFGWDPPWFNEQELHRELWSLTSIALRNWLIRAAPPRRSHAPIG